MTDVLQAGRVRQGAAVKRRARRIILVRHGRPSHPYEGSLTASEYEDWWSEYELSGLAEGEEPPPELLKLAGESDLIFSSTLLRAQETAARLAGDRDVQSDVLFVEMPLPRPPLPLMRAGPHNWGWIARTFWILGRTGDGESAVAGIRRAREIADRLIRAAEDGQTVMLCAHGFTNWMVNVALRLRGWRRTYNGGNAYWSWGAFERGTDRHR